MESKKYVMFLKPAFEKAYGVDKQFNPCDKYKYNEATLKLIEDNIYEIVDEEDFFETVSAVYRFFGCFFCYVSDEFNNLKKYSDDIATMFAGVSNLDVVWLNIYREDDLPVSINGRTPYKIYLRNGLVIEGVGRTNGLWRNVGCNYRLIESMAKDLTTKDSRMSTTYAQKVCNMMRVADIATLPHVLYHCKREGFNNHHAIVFKKNGRFYTIEKDKACEDVLLMYATNPDFLDFIDVCIYWDLKPGLFNVHIDHIIKGETGKYRMTINSVNDIAELYRKLEQIGGINIISKER